MEKIRVGIQHYDEAKLETTTSYSEVVNIVNLISEPLLRMYDGKIWPALARSWQTFEHGKRWLFYLAPNTLFSDSTPCTMIDVLEAIDHVKSVQDEYGRPSQYSEYLKDFEFSILNRYALQVTCPKPCGDLAEILSSISILKKNRLDKRIIGTGNYKYASYWANKSVRLTKLSGLKHLSAYNQITFFIIPNAEDRLEALRKGDVHIAAELESTDPNDRNDGNAWWTCKTNQSVMGLLNGYHGPFNQPIARKAVNLAINVDYIIRKVLGGYGIPSTSVVSPYHCGYANLLDPIPYDPPLARKLFSQVDIDHELVITAAKGYPIRAFEIADIIAEQLADVGIKSRVEKYDDMEEYYKKVSVGNLGDIMLMWTSNNSTFRLLYDAVSSKIKGPFWQGVTDDVLETMIEEAHEECDITDRERKYSKVVAYLNRNPQWLYLYHPLTVYARNPEVVDVETLHTGEFRFPGAW